MMTELMSQLNFIAYLSIAAGLIFFGFMAWAEYTMWNIMLDHPRKLTTIVNSYRDSGRM